MNLSRTLTRSLASSAAVVVVSFGMHGVAGAAPVESCPQGAVATVIDDNGVAQQACVAVEVVAAVGGPAPSDRSSAVGTSSLPSTGAKLNGALIGAALVAAGAAASLASRRRA